MHRTDAIRGSTSRQIRKIPVVRFSNPAFVMPYRFEFDVEHKLLLIVLEGDILVRDVEPFNGHIRQRVEELKPSSAIADFSGVTSFDVAGDTLRRAAGQPAPFPVETPRYIVAPSDYLYGMARMYQLAANRPQEKLQVVRAMKEALSALGVQNPNFVRLP